MASKRSSAVILASGISNTHGMMILGFALCQTWLTLCFFAPQLFNTEATINVYDLSLAVTVLSLLPAVFRPKVVEVIVYRKSYLMAVGVIATIGTILVPFASPSGFFGIMAFVLAGILTGIGSGWLFISWYCAILNLHDYAGYILAVALNAALLYLFTNLLLPPVLSPWVLVAVGVALPIPSILILSHYTTSYAKKEYDTSLPKGSAQRREVINLCLAVFIVSSVCEFLRNIFLSGTDLAFYSTSTYLVLLIIKMVVALILIIAIGRQERSISFWYRITILLIAFATVAEHVIDANFGYALINIGAFIFKIMVTLVTFQLIERFRVNQVFVFAIVRIIWALDVLFGSALVSAYERFTPLYPIIGAWAFAIAAFMLFIVSLFILSDERITPNFAPEQVQSVLDVEARCARIARTDKLSPRESEILVLLARGRSTPRIQEELTLSENTVNSHIRHIFQKVNVHSRQELLDLIEKTEA